MVQQQDEASVSFSEENKKAQQIKSQNGPGTELKQIKEVIYQKPPGVKIGQGKFGPIELVIYKNDLYALKRIPKTAIDKAKRIEHLKNEKKWDLFLKELPKPSYFADLEETFAD